MSGWQILTGFAEETIRNKNSQHDKQDDCKGKHHARSGFRNALCDPNVIQPEIPAIQNRIGKARFAELKPDRLEFPISRCQSASVPGVPSARRRAGAPNPVELNWRWRIR